MVPLSPFVLLYLKLKVAEGLKGYANIASPEGGKDYKRLDDVKNIHFIISKLLARKLITRIHVRATTV